MISAISNNPMSALFSYGQRDGESVVLPEQAFAAGQSEEENENVASPEQNEIAGSDDKTLSSEEQRLVAELKETDAKVRIHEAMHIAAGGGLITSGASYTYQTGPDGVRYAVGGEVGIDASKGSTPEETIQKAGRIRAAALAPADPSSQDRSVAAMASQMEMQALQEAAQQRLAGEKEEKADTTGENPGIIAKEPDTKEKDAGISERVRALALAAYQSVAGWGISEGMSGLSAQA